MNKKWIIVTLIVVIILGIAYDQHKKYYAYCAARYTSMVMIAFSTIVDEQQAKFIASQCAKIIDKYGKYDKAKFGEGLKYALDVSEGRIESDSFCKSAGEYFSKTYFE